jgi:hypothetical protein
MTLASMTEYIEIQQDVMCTYEINLFVLFLGIAMCYNKAPYIFDWRIMTMAQSEENFRE